MGRHRKHGPAVTSPAPWGYDTARHRREWSVHTVFEADYFALLGQEGR